MPNLRVFINGTAHDVAPGATVLDAVRTANPAEAVAIERGERMAVDSRGLPADHLAAVFAGAIYRTQRAKSAPG
jgi:hypothetical protein